MPLHKSTIHHRSVNLLSEKRGEVKCHVSVKKIYVKKVQFFFQVS